MSILKYLVVLSCAFLGLFLAVMVMPKVDDIIYPFSPNFSLWWQFDRILFGLGFLSMAAALIGSWVYKNTISFAALSAVAAILLDFKFSIFVNWLSHEFHFSFILAYIFGVLACALLVKLLLNKFSSKEHITHMSLNTVNR